MQGAALIVGVGGTMIVVATTVVDMMVVAVSRGAGAGDIFGDVLFARDDMLEMDADQRHNAREIGQNEQPQKPWRKTPPNVP